jgi:hypothetical protein
MKRIFGFLYFAFCLFTLSAQIDSSQIYYRKIGDHFLGDSLKLSIDTNLFGIHQPNSISYLGNIGLTQMPSLFQFTPQDLSNQAYLTSLNVPVFSLKDVYFGHSRKPIFSVYAFSGRGQEQLLDAFHTQTLRKQFSYTFRLYRGNSQGFVNRQRSNYSQFYLALHIAMFKNKKGTARLKMMPFLINNLNNFNENGGVSVANTLDSLYSKVNILSSSQINFLKVKLTNANRKLQNLAFGSENTWLLTNDTLAKIKKQLVHTIFVDRQKNSYSDANAVIKDSSIYPIVYDTNAFTKDSMHHFVFSNALAYRVENRGRYFYDIGAKHENTIYINHGDKNYYDNYSLFFKGAKTVEVKQNNLALSAKADYCFIGSLQNGLVLSSRADWWHKDSIRSIWHLQGQIEVSNRKPLLFYQQYAANSFVWHNRFGSTYNQQIEVIGSYLPLRISVGAYHQITNKSIVMSRFQRPDQVYESISNLRLFASHQFAWRRLRFFNTVNYQSTSNKDLVAIPSFYTKHSLFFESKLIKKNFKFQAGVDIQYLSSFKPYQYSPALNQFYLQETFVSKDQIYADAFFNVYIRPAYIFIKLEHANQFYFPQTSEVLQGYVLKPRALRFGLKWNFLD